MERPVPSRPSPDHAPLSATVRTTRPFRGASSTRTRRRRARARSGGARRRRVRARSRAPPASDTARRGLDLLARAEPLDEHGAQPLDELAEIDVVVALLGQHLVHGGDGEDPVHRVLERLRRVRPGRAGLEPQERRDGLEVVLDPVVDLLSEDAAQDRPAVLERHRGVVRDRGEELCSSAVNGVSRSQTSSPTRRPSSEAAGDRMPAGAPLGPRDLPVLETSAAPVAPTASIVVRTIAPSDSSR